MKRFRGFTCIVGILLLLLASCTSRSGGTLENKDKTIELTTKEHVMKAMKTAPPVENTFIVIKAHTIVQPESMSYLDGQFSLITQEDYQKIKAQYGDIVNPSNKGHIVALKHIQRKALIAEDRASQKKLAELIEMSSKRLCPVIKITTTEVRVTELTYQKNKVFLSGDVGKHYLVSKIEVLKDNYIL
ncbi:MAG TPA: hypothetical protein VMU10_13010 [Desulfomonilia bacterium]|nr:hypothetical protein [Desulfomonilia bacterium]